MIKSSYTASVNQVVVSPLHGAEYEFMVELKNVEGKVYSFSQQTGVNGEMNVMIYDDRTVSKKAKEQSNG